MRPLVPPLVCRMCVPDEDLASTSHGRCVHRLHVHAFSIRGGFVCVTRRIVSVGQGVRKRRVVKGSRANLVIYNRACPPPALHRHPRLSFAMTGNFPFLSLRITPIAIESLNGDDRCRSNERIRDGIWTGNMPDVLILKWSFSSKSDKSN